MERKTKRIEFTSEDFLAYMKSAQCAGLATLLLFGFMVFAIYDFYIIALPTGISQDANIAQGEAIAYAVVLNALFYIVFAHEDINLQDSLSLGVLTFFYIVWVFLLLVNPFDMWGRQVLMQLTILFTIPTEVYILVLNLKTKLSQ